MPKEKKKQLDRINIEILQRLSKEGRVPYSTLADDLKCSTNAVRDRIHALERRGVILGYQAIIDEKKLGHPVHVLALLEPDPSQQADPSAAREALGVRVNAVAQSTGPYSLVLEMVGKSLEDIHVTLQDCIYPMGYGGARLVMLGKNLLATDPPAQKLIEEAAS